MVRRRLRFRQSGVVVAVKTSLSTNNRLLIGFSLVSIMYISHKYILCNYLYFASVNSWSVPDRLWILHQFDSVFAINWTGSLCDSDIAKSFDVKEVSAQRCLLPPVANRHTKKECRDSNSQFCLTSLCWDNRVFDRTPDSLHANLMPAQIELLGQSLSFKLISTLW